MKLEPKFARVLLEREKVKASGIIIPESAEKRNAPVVGTVVAVGPTADESIKIDSKVIFGRHAGDWIKSPDGREFFICQDEDILVEVKDE